MEATQPRRTRMEMDTMKPEEIPQDFVDAAVDGWHNAPNENGRHTVLLDDVMRHVLANVLPAHEALVRKMVAGEITAYGRERMDRAVDRVMSDDPGGQAAAMRAATVCHVANYVRAKGGEEA